jgi:hypothetical protein
MDIGEIGWDRVLFLSETLSQIHIIENRYTRAGILPGGWLYSSYGMKVNPSPKAPTGHGGCGTC